MESGVDLLLFFILGLVYLSSFVFAVVRFVCLMKNPRTWKLTRLFYMWITLQTLLRTITFAVAIFEMQKNSLELDYLLLNIPDSLFISSYLILFWQLITVCMISHVTSARTMLSNLPTKRLAQTAKLIILCNALWLLLEAVLYLLICVNQLHYAIKEFETSAVNFFLPIFILLYCFYLQYRYSGAPFRSSSMGALMKVNSRVVLIWSVLRVIRGGMGLLAMLGLGTSMVSGTVKLDSKEHIFAAVVFIIVLLLTEVLCYFLVLDSNYFTKFLFTTDPPALHLDSSSSLQASPSLNSSQGQVLLPISPSPFINKSQLHDLSIISSRKHSLGTVLKATYNDQLVSVRRIDFPRMNNYVFEEVLDEVEDLTEQSCPYILPLIGWCIEQPSIQLIMPYVEMSLFRVVHEERRRMRGEERRKVMREVAEGMERVYRKGKTHGHLNSRNVMMDRDGAKVSDIGLHKLKKFASVVLSYSNKGAWSSPEQLLTRSKTATKVVESDDVYSFGILMWEVVTGEQPFEGVGVERLKDMVAVDNLRPSLPPTIDEDLSTLIRSCWNSDPRHRPTFANILESLNRLHNE